MTKQVIFYTKGLRYEVGVEGDKTFLLGATEKAQVYLQQQDRPIQLKSDDEEVFYQYGEEVGLLKDGLALGDTVFYLRDAEPRVYDLLDQQELHVGSQKGALIKLDEDIELLLKKSQGSWTLTRLKGDFYRNNHLEKKDQQLLNFGDEISIGSVTIKIYPDEVWLYGFAQAGSQLALRDPSRYGFYEDYPDYHRSPRIIYRSSEEKIQIAPPSKEPNKPSDELLRLIVPPLLMVGVTVLITLVQPRGIYILATVVMSIASVIFSVRGFFKNRKKYKADKKERIDLYHLYLKDKAMELARLEREQKEGMHYHFPTVLELTDLVESYNHRIYEKTSLHFDFLYYRLGLGKLPTSYQLTYGQEERSGKKDALEEEGYALYSRHKKIPDMPIPANLNHGPVGYVGPRNLVLEQLQLLVMQLATFHSYHDVQFITILPEEERDQWSWMRWLPHAKLQELNVRGFVYNQRTRDQVLNSLNQILKLRRSQKEEASHKESTLFHPHYVVLVTDEKLILDHVIMEFFTEDPTELGCSLVFVEDVMSSLSENIQTVINIKDRNTGQLVMEEGVLKETDFRLDHFPADYDKERIARTLAPLNHLQNLKSSIPDTVTFMEMYGAETFEDLQVSRRWEKNAPYKSLAVPIGLRGKDDIVQLNLHEKAHGPHGLIAGTTGSGKSETIQSYILSLAVNFHPHDVAFLLIDYKGGGMANLFKNLPHLLGTITNLDGAQSMRALASINAEIHRREQLFGEFEVNHINQYQKKFRNGEATEPLPHLFLISDEFAELKVNQPDFIKELVSIARVGRSLGVHLILATQKPSGVVDDQIWSNSRFKLALKVADRGDSMEMLHTPDAAEITQIGRAYLQVGNNEVYELFQSAWSGADYQPDKDDMGIEDHTIYLINELGQYEILNEDLSGLEEADEIKEVPTELDAIVQNIKLLTEEQNIPPVPQPWLPPLKERIYSTDLRKGKFKEFWGHTDRPLKAVIGYVDVPSQQAQYALEHDFNEDGNIALFGGPLTGKSTFIQTLTMDLARQFTPTQVNFYLLDFGTNGLLPLRQLPHVADTIMIDDQEKITKVISRIKGEIRYRKALLRKHMVADVNLYQEISGHQIPKLFFMLDGYDAIKESPLVLDIENTFQVIAREGLSLGIYLVITAGRLGVVKSALLSSIKTRISLKLTDDADTRTLIGRTQLIIEDKPGRAMIKLDEPEIFQVALPTNGNDTFELIEQISSEAGMMSEEWDGNRPKPIPIVPEELTFDTFARTTSVQTALKENNLPLGLDFVNVESVDIPMRGFKHMLYIANEGEHLENITRHLLEIFTNLTPSKKVMFMDVDDEYDGQFDLFARISEPEALADMANQFILELEDRKKGETGHDFIIFIPNLEKFVQASGLTGEQVSTLYQEGWKYNMHFVVGSFYSYISNNAIGSPARQVKAYNQYYLLGMRLTDQTILEKPYNSKEPYLNKDELYLYGHQSSVKIKITI